MKYLRCNESHDPELFRISKVVPDRWIDEHWPQKQFSGKGRWKRLSASQLVRVHFLALLKGLSSFNRVCRELHHNPDFRRFCRMAPGDSAPTSRMLSEFREDFGISGWTSLHVCALRSLTRLHEPFAIGVVLPDASDMPAAIRKSSKKKTAPRPRNGASKQERAKAHGRKKADNPYFSRDTKNTRFMACFV